MGPCLPLPPLFALCAAAIASLPVALPQGGPPDEAPAPVPTVVLESAVGDVKRVPLEGFETTDPRRDGGALLRFENLGAAPALPAGEGLADVELAFGGLARGVLLGGEEELLDLAILGGGRLRLPIESIASLRVPARIPRDWTGPVTAAEEGDRLYRTLERGLDRIDGTVEGFSAQGVTMDSELGSKLFPWREVAALFVEVLGEEAVRPERGLPVVVDLVDGSRLLANLSRISEEDGLELLTSKGHGLRLPNEAVSELLVVGAGLVFLSDLEPDEAEPTSPFGDDLGMRWEARRDRTTGGGPLRAGGRVWTRGIGVHAPSRLAYRLEEEWAHLRGFVCLDDEVLQLPARGSVRFRIHGDDRVLWESPVMRGGDIPVPIPPVPLAGVRRLVLEADAADQMHVGDRADWLRLILAR